MLNWIAGGLYHTVLGWRYLRFPMLMTSKVIWNIVQWRLVNRLQCFGVALHTSKVRKKCTLVQALRLCTGRTAHRGSRGIALPFHDHGTRRGWGVSVMPRPIFTPGKDPVPIVQEAGWAQATVWTGAVNLAHTGIRSPDRPARSQSLYRLSYPAHCEQHTYSLLKLKSVWKVKKTQFKWK